MAAHPGERVLRRRRRLWIYLAMAGLAVFFLFPLVFMFVSSLKPDGQILSDVGGWRAFLPLGDISFRNYTGVFDRVPVGRFLLNSLFVTTAIVGAGLVINSMAGFAISRLRWTGRGVVLSYDFAWKGKSTAGLPRDNH